MNNHALGIFLSVFLKPFNGRKGAMNTVKTITIRLDPMTSDQLDGLARRKRRTKAKIIRQLITAAALGLTREDNNL